MKSANLALRFLLELCALGALGYWGATAQARLFPRTLLAIGAPLLAALFWGMFVSPRVRVVLPTTVRMVLGLAVFAAATAALIARGRVTAGVTLGGLALLNAILMIVWRQDVMTAQ